MVFGDVRFRLGVDPLVPTLSKIILIIKVMLTAKKAQFLDAPRQKPPGQEGKVPIEFASAAELTWAAHKGV